MGRILRGMVVAVALAVSFVSCGGGGGGSAPTTPTPTPSVTSVTVTGPTTTAKPGDSGQFTATATFSNNTTQTVTNQATWQSSNTGVATVSSTGFATAVGPGEVDIRASYQNFTGSAHVTVTASGPAPSPTPAGFSICGTTKEDTGSTPVPGATVIVKDTAIAASSDASGHYCVGGLSTGSFTLRATRSGYDIAEVGVSVSGNTSADIPMHKQGTAPPPTTGPTPTPPSPDPTPGPNGPTCNAAAYPSSAPNCGSPTTAVCNDGSLSCSKSRSGTCSSHGGVKCWLCPGLLCNSLIAGQDYSAAAAALIPPAPPVALLGSERPDRTPAGCPWANGL